MTTFTQASRDLAEQLPLGEHRLTNTELRQLYGIRRVTAKTRGEIAIELQRAGLRIVSDPSKEPLVVAKIAPSAAAVAASRAGGQPTKKPWWRRRWAIATGGIVALFILMGALSSPEDDEVSSDTRARSVVPLAHEGEASTGSTATDKAPTETLSDAQSAVRDDRYAEALAIAAALGADEESRIERSIARRLASRARDALSKGNRSRAARLLRSADRYPAVASVVQAKASLRSAQKRASQRAAARRRAEQQAAVRREQPATPAASSDGCDPNYSGCVPAGVGDVNCDDLTETDIRVVGRDVYGLDGHDGDGIACES